MTDAIKRKLQDEIDALEHELIHELPKEIKKAAALGESKHREGIWQGLGAEGRAFNRIDGEVVLARDLAPDEAATSSPMNLSTSVVCCRRRSLSSAAGAMA